MPNNIMTNKIDNIPVAIPLNQIICRICNKEFTPYTNNIYSAQCYRCPECNGGKALIRACINSCTIS